MKSIFSFLCLAVAALTLSSCSTYHDGTPVYSYRNPHYTSYRVTTYDRRYDRDRDHRYSSRYRRSYDRHDHDRDDDRRTVRYRRGVDTRVNANVTLLR